VLRRPEGAVRVLVHGLEDRLVLAQMSEVLSDDVHVVAVGMQRRDVALFALLAVVLVVVVGPDVGHLLLAEDVDEPARDRRLPRRRVADDAKDDRSWHCYAPLADPPDARRMRTAKAVDHHVIRLPSGTGPAHSPSTGA